MGTISLSSQSRLEFIVELGRLVLGEKPLEERAITFARDVCKYLGVDACVIRLLEEDELVLLGSFGVPVGQLSTRMPVNVGIAEELTNARKPVVIRDAALDPRTAALHHQAKDDSNHFTFVSYAGVPMEIDGRLIGVMAVYTTEQPATFGDETVEELLFAATHVSVALVNHRIYERLEEKNRLIRSELLASTRFEGEVRYGGLHDRLTGLPNRILLLEHLRHCLRMASSHIGYEFSLCIFGLDRFKMLNDTLGHHIGDDYLVLVAKRIRAVIRQGDTLARIGGDSFGILLGEARQGEEINLVVSSINSALARSTEVGGHQIRSSASIGIARGGATYARAEDIIADAETAMYAAKSRGRGTHAVFKPAMRARNDYLLGLDLDLRKAVEANQFFLDYQPIFTTAGREFCGCEALVRWQHPTRGLIMPSQFIPLAEETGVILDLGMLVLSMAIKELSSWPASSCYMSVNLSARQFFRPSLAEDILALLQHHGVAPDRLRLEITESILMSRSDFVVASLHALLEEGVQIFMDDFGTGYSSLMMLRTIPASVLKIDRTFIENIDNEDDLRLAGAIVKLAHSLELRTIAEGVETEAQLAAMLDAGCDFIQGYLLARPIPADQLRQFFEQTCEAGSEA